MNWQIVFRKRFFHDLASLPTDVRNDIEKLLRMPIENPFLLPSLKKLGGHTDKFRLRFGEYRVGLTIDKRNRQVVIERCAPRKDIYRTWP